MRALVIAPEPFFTPRGTPLSVYHRTRVVAELGVAVDLLIYGQGQDVEMPGVRMIRTPALRWLGPVKVGPSFLKAVHDFFIALRAVTLLLRHRYDFVHAHEESVFLARFLKPLFGFKLVYDMHSSLPQQLVNFQFSSWKPLIWAFQRLERTSLRTADAVITICPELARSALEQMSEPRRHFLIENSLLDEVRYKGGAPLAEKAQTVEPPMVPSDRPLVLYAGSFEAYQGLHLLVPAFAKLRARRPDAFLALIGGLPAQVEQLAKLVVEHGLGQHAVVAGRQDQAVTRALTRRAAVLVSPRDRGTNTPLKIYEQLASGVPLVATRILAHTQVIDDDVAILTDPTVDGLADGLRAALDNEQQRRQVVAGATALYESRYSPQTYRNGVAKLLDLLRGEPQAAKRASL